MNEKIITGKLEDFLERHPKFNEECEVVYLLAEIRKIIENKNKEHKKGYETLRFYCNWVLHSKMSYQSTIDFLSSQFNDRIDLDKSKREIQKDLKNRQKDFFMLKNFKSQLHKFLENHSLPTETLEGNGWHKFCKLFLENIIECQIDFGAKVKSCKISRLSVEKANQSYYYLFYLSNGMRIDRIGLKYKKK